MKAPGRILLLAFLVQLTAACAHVGRADYALGPDDKQFLSEVRFIITKNERKIFNKIPPGERAQFIEEFWKQRDPDPMTEENEFRNEYYRRIEQANHLFREGSSGWLSDRGRIYIMLGEPERREVYPSGYTFYEPPVEIWYYGNFPIIFVDRFREGSYRLEPISAKHIAMINLAQRDMKPGGITRAANAFDFVLRLEKNPGNQVAFLIAVPYKVLKLTQKPGSESDFETQVKVDIRVVGANGDSVARKSEVYPVATTQDKLADLAKDLDIRVDLQLPPGSYTATVKVLNATDDSQVSKNIKFKL